MTGLVSDKRKLGEDRREFLSQRLQTMCTAMSHGDWWSTDLGDLMDSEGIINANDSAVQLYLANLNMLWGLGLKKIKHPLGEAEQEAEQRRLLDSMFNATAKTG